MEIIDSHVHPPLETGRNLCWFPEWVSTASPEAFVAELREAGISRCCGAVICKPLGVDRRDSVPEMNRAARGFSERVGDFYVPAVQLDLTQPEESCRELEFYYHHGFRWIGELYQRSPDESAFLSDGAFQVYELAVTLGVPISIHAKRLDVFPELCTNLPALSIVLSQPMTEQTRVQECLRLVSRYRNLYWDLSADARSRPGIIEKAVAELGSHKILFGSGFPLRRPSSAVADYLYAGLNPSQLELIFSGNFKRLTGIE